jgi:hypothetical protein
MRQRWLCAVGVLAACGVAGCGDDDGGPGAADATIDVQGADAGPATGTVEGRVFHALTREPVAGAQVKVTTGTGDEVVVTTDAQGKFTAQAPAQASAVIKAEGEGLEASLKTVPVPEGNTAYLELASMPVGQQTSLDADHGGEIHGPLGASIKLPAGGLVTMEGAPVTGTVLVTVTPLLPQDPRQLAARPGKARGKRPDDSTVGMAPMVTLAATLKQGDALVTLAAGQEATLKLPVADPASPKTVALWSLDESTGEWVQEGAIAKVDTHEGAFYKGKVGHFSFWSAEVPMEASGCLRGCVSGTTGSVRVVAEGVDRTFREEVSTNGTGCYALDVPLAGRVRVRAVGPDGASARATVSAPDAEGSAEDPGTCDEVDVLDLTPAADPDCPAGTVRCGSACVDPTSDARHCGGCEQGCGEGVADGTLPAGATCVDGTCGCPPWRPDDCDGRCTDRQSSLRHCGTCGEACDAGEECAAGTCQGVTCPDGTVLCDGQCVDTDDDVRHCGGCVADGDPEAQDCDDIFWWNGARDLVCEGGTCGCAAGLIHCDWEGDMCLDPMTDADACGSCDSYCMWGQEVCVAGECRDDGCPEGTEICGGTCVDIDDDPNHCGGCFNSCATGLCEGGECACPDGLTDCDDDPLVTNCVDLNRDNDNCGTCGEPCGGVCCGGGCTGGPFCVDSTSCGCGCVDLATDPDHCGSCNSPCGDNEQCSAETCECVPGAERCEDDVCILLATSDAHCGACNHPCGPGQRCQGGVCVY